MGEVFPSHGHATRKHRAATRISKGSPLTSTQSSNSNRAAAKGLVNTRHVLRGLPRQLLDRTPPQQERFNTHHSVKKLIGPRLNRKSIAVRAFQSLEFIKRTHVATPMYTHACMYVYMYAQTWTNERACEDRYVAAARSQQRCIHVSVGG